MHEKDLPTQKNLAQRRGEFADLSVNELIERRAKFEVGSASQIAASRLLSELESRNSILQHPLMVALVSGLISLAVAYAVYCFGWL